MTPVLPEPPKAVQWTDDGEAVHLLDQTLLPREEKYLRLETVDQVSEAIFSLRVRGAPAIGIAGAFGLAMGLRSRVDSLGGSARDEPIPKALGDGFRQDRDLLRETRPTAVNLAWAVDRLSKVFHDAQGSAGAVLAAVTREANLIAQEDEEMCRLIGEHGLGVIPESGARVLTHCNAGALATGGIGTALAPIYTAHARGIPVEVFADETRPLLQGARITSWELQKAGVDVTVLTDSMAGALMRSGGVDMVIVGTDRVAANGDVANKIGTYGVAVLAREHGLPFYVALPRSTFDPEAASGEEIPIEERDPGEVSGFAGHRTAPEGVGVWNPAFDVTPAHLVTAFITDGGILRPPFDVAIASLLRSQGPADSGASEEGS